MGVTYSTTNAGITYTPIATTTLGVASSTITLSGLSANYTDLVLVADTLVGSTIGMDIRVNNDSGTHYSQTRMYGTGSSTGSDNLANTSTSLYSWNTTNNTTLVTHFMNYSNTTTYKTFLSRTSSIGNAAGAYASMWRGLTGSSTEAINRIDLIGTGNFAVGTTVSIFGVKAA